LPIRSRRAITSVHRRAVLGFYPPRQAWRSCRQFPSPCSHTAPYTGTPCVAQRTTMIHGHILLGTGDNCLHPVHQASLCFRKRGAAPRSVRPVLSEHLPVQSSTDCGKTDVGRTEIVRAAAITRVRVCIESPPFSGLIYRTQWLPQRQTGLHYRVIGPLRVARSLSAAPFHARAPGTTESPPSLGG
jgi:hypothetical protein